MTGVLGNGQRPCCPLPCEFSQKCGFCENSLLLYLPAIRGGGDTEAVQKLTRKSIFEPVLQIQIMLAKKIKACIIVLSKFFV